MKAARPSALMRALWWISLVVFIASLLWISGYLIQTASQTRALNELSAFVHGSNGARPADNTASDTQIKTELPLTGFWRTAYADTLSEPEAADELSPQESLLDRYMELAAMNPDFIGWIYIGNTAIDYPVMHSPSAPERYLRRDFYGNFSFAGLPFLDASCENDDEPGNSIIYGHNMRNGTMFAGLLKYRDREFLDANPLIQYDTLNSQGVYQIIAVFDLRATARSSPSMLCYQLIDTASQEAIDQLNSYIEEYALLRADEAGARLNDRLLTLSTCVKATSEQRLIVMARRVSYAGYA